MGWPIVAAVAGQALSSMGNKKAAKKSRRAQEQQNKENRKAEAITNLIRLAGGQGMGSLSSQSAPTHSPAEESLSIFGDIAKTAGAGMQMQADKDLAAQIRSEDLNRAEMNRFEDQNIRAHELEAKRQFDELVRGDKQKYYEDLLTQRAAANQLAQQRLPTEEERIAALDYRRALTEEARRRGIAGGGSRPSSIAGARELTGISPLRSPASILLTR